MPRRRRFRTGTLNSSGRAARFSPTSRSSSQPRTPIGTFRYEVVTTNLAYGTPAITTSRPLPRALHRAIPLTNTTQVRTRCVPGDRQAIGPVAANGELTSSSPQCRDVLLRICRSSFSTTWQGVRCGVAPAQNQSVIVMLFEPVNGRTSLTNPPRWSHAPDSTSAEQHRRLRNTSGARNLDESIRTTRSSFLACRRSPIGCSLPGQFRSFLFAQPADAPASRDVGRYSSRRGSPKFFSTHRRRAGHVRGAGGGNYFGLTPSKRKSKRATTG